MNLFQALLSTYEYAESQQMVDDFHAPNVPTLLPLYHSNRRSSGKMDIAELTISEKGEFLEGRFLDEGEYVVFPVSETSVVRTANPCPHPLFDDFAYVAGSFDDPDSLKHKMYLEGLEPLSDFEKKHPNRTFRAIYDYVTRHDVKQDVLTVIKQTTAGTGYFQGKEKSPAEGEKKGNLDQINWYIDKNGKTELHHLLLPKIFIVFKVELNDETSDNNQMKLLHQFYIDYVNAQIKTDHSKDDYCDVSGEKQYCIFTHRGIMGTAKLIGISNHPETWRGRFKTGEEVVHVGYVTSQKVHNMLKFLMDSDAYKRYLGGSSYVISWMSHDLLLGGMPITSGVMASEEDEDDEKEEETVPSETYVLGSNRSRSITDFVAGIKDIKNTDIDNYFCVLMMEQINNGRIAVKYFRTFSNSDLKKRVTAWFHGLDWPIYSKQKQKRIAMAPSLFSITNVLVGDDSDKAITVSAKKEKVRVNFLERLMECMLEGKPLPRDIMELGFQRIINPATFRYHLGNAHLVVGSLIKKYEMDHGTQVVDQEGELISMSDRSFIYGRILAVYDQMESYAMKLRSEESSSEKAGRPTNASRLWTAMIQRPQQTTMELQKRTQYCRTYLLKSHKGYVVTLDKILGDLYTEILTLNKSDAVNNRPVNENFILGFYYQKQQFFTKHADHKSENKTQAEEA